METNSTPTPPAGYPCVIESTDFSENTVTLKMTGKYAVSAGQYLLVPVKRLMAPADTSAAPVDLMEDASIETSESDARPWAPVVVAESVATPLAIARSSDALRDVAAERLRQIEFEGYDPEHDDEHVNDEIAALACFFAMPPGAREWDASSTGYGLRLGDAILPHGWASIEDGDRRRELVKAGALILAEIERLDRANDHESKASMPKVAAHV